MSSISYKYKIVLWKFDFATSKIRAMQIRAMRIRASRGMTVWYFGAILLHDTSYVYIFQCRLLHGGKIIVKRGVLLPRFMTNSRMMEIILNRELKSSREATKIGRGFVQRRQELKHIYKDEPKNNRIFLKIGYDTNKIALALHKLQFFYNIFSSSVVQVSLIGPFSPNSKICCIMDW